MTLTGDYVWKGTLLLEFLESGRPTDIDITNQIIK